MIVWWRNIVIVALLCSGLIFNGCTHTTASDIPLNATAFCYVDGKEWIAYVRTPWFCDTSCPESLYFRFGGVWGSQLWIRALSDVSEPGVIEFECEGVRDTGRYQFDYVIFGSDTLIDRDSSWLTVTQLDSALNPISGRQSYTVVFTFQFKVYSHAEQRWMYVKKDK